MLPDTAPHSHLKICGLTRPEDAVLAMRLGATFVGLIFAEGTPRCLTPGQADRIVAALRGEFPAVRPIGVFVHEPASMIHDLVDRLKLVAVQLHGQVLDNLAVPSLRAVRVRDASSAGEIERALEAGPVLLDSFVEGKHGGTGKVFDHELAMPFLRRPDGRVFLAGGLNPDNIGAVAGRLAAAGALPYAFDVSSGLEASPGVKSPEKMTRFVEEWRRAAGNSA